MRHRYTLLLTALLFISATGISAQESGNSWTLQRAVHYAVDHNISIQQGDVDRRLAALQLKQSQLAQLPSLVGGGALGKSYGRSINPTTNAFEDNGYNFTTLVGSSNVLLFGWFQQRNLITGNKLQARAAKAELDQLKNDVSLNVATGYLRILLAWEQMVIAQKQIDLTRSQLNSTARAAKAGVTPDLSVAQLEAQLATDSANMIISLSNTQAAVLELKAMLNLDLNAPFEVVPPTANSMSTLAVDKLEPEVVYAQAARNLGILRAGELRVKAAERYWWSARGAMLPRLTASADFGSSYVNIAQQRAITGYTEQQISNTYINMNGTDYPIYQRTPTYTTNPYLFTNQVSDNFRRVFALNLTVPLFNGWTANYGAQRAKLNIRSQELALNDAQVKLKQQVYKANTDVKNAAQIYNAARRSTEAAGRAFSFAQKRYNVGLNNTVEYLTILNTYYLAQSRLLSAKYDLLFKMKVIDYYTGQELVL